MSISPSQASTLQCIDVFKVLGIPNRNVDKKGNISYTLNKELGKMSYNMWGAIPSANRIEIPKIGSNTLNLQSRYVYIQMRPTGNVPAVAGMGPREPVPLSGAEKGQMPQISYFSFTIMVDTMNSSPIRITITNVATALGVTPNAITIPLGLRRWSVIAIDLAGLISHVYSTMDPPVTRCYMGIRRFIFCANCSIRTVFSSDKLLTPFNLPSTMMLPPPKDMGRTSSASRKPLSGSDFVEFYDWIVVGEDATPTLMLLGDETVQPMLSNAVKEAQTERAVKEAVGKAKERVRKLVAKEAQDGDITQQHRTPTVGMTLKTGKIQSSGCCGKSHNVKSVGFSSKMETNTLVSGSKRSNSFERRPQTEPHMEAEVGCVLFSKYTGRTDNSQSPSLSSHDNTPKANNATPSTGQRAVKGRPGSAKQRSKVRTNQDTLAGNKENNTKTQPNANAVGPLLAYKKIFGANHPSVTVPKQAASPFAIPLLDGRFLAFVSGARIVLESLPTDLMTNKELGDAECVDVCAEDYSWGREQFIIALNSPVTSLSPTSVANMFSVGCCDGTVLLYKVFDVGTARQNQYPSVDPHERCSPFDNISVVEVGYCSALSTQIIDVTHVVISDNGNNLLVIGRPLTQSPSSSGFAVRLFSTASFAGSSIPPKDPRELKPITLLHSVPGDGEIGIKRVIQACFIDGASCPIEGDHQSVRFVTLTSSTILLWRIKQLNPGEQPGKPLKLCCHHVAVNRSIICGYVVAALKANMALRSDGTGKVLGECLLYNNHLDRFSSIISEPLTGERNSPEFNGTSLSSTRPIIMHYTCMYYPTEPAGGLKCLLIGTTVGAILSLDPTKMHVLPQTTGVIKQANQLQGGKGTGQLDSYSHSPSVLEVMLPFNLEDVDAFNVLPRVRSIGDVAFTTQIKIPLGRNQNCDVSDNCDGSSDTSSDCTELKEQGSRIGPMCCVDRRIVTSVSYQSKVNTIHEIRVWRSLENRILCENSGGENGSNGDGTKIREVVFEARFEAPVCGIVRTRSCGVCRHVQQTSLEHEGGYLDVDTKNSVILTTTNGVVGFINTVTGTYKTLLRTNIGWNTGCERTQVSPITAFAPDPLHPGDVATINVSNVVQVWSDTKLEYEFSVGGNSTAETPKFTSQVLVYHPTNYAIAVASNTCVDTGSCKRIRGIALGNKIFNIDIIDDAEKGAEMSSRSEEQISKRSFGNISPDGCASFVVAMKFGCSFGGLTDIHSPSLGGGTNTTMLYALMNDSLIAKMCLCSCHKEYSLVGTIHSSFFPSRRCFDITRWNEDIGCGTDLIFGVCQDCHGIELIEAPVDTDDGDTRAVMLTLATNGAVGFGKRSKVMSSAILTLQTEENTEPDALVVTCLVAYLVLRDSPSNAPGYCDPGRFIREGYVITVSVCLQRHVLSKEMLRNTGLGCLHTVQPQNINHSLPNGSSVELPTLSSLQVYACEANEELYKAVGPVQSPKCVDALTLLANINAMPKPVCARLDDHNSYAYLLFTPECDAISVSYGESITEKLSTEINRRQQSCGSNATCIRDTGMPPVEDMAIIPRKQFQHKNSRQLVRGHICAKPFIVCCTHCPDTPESTSVTVLEWDPLGGP